jgi:hypothetical protein
MFPPAVAVPTVMIPLLDFKRQEEAVFALALQASRGCLVGECNRCSALQAGIAPVSGKHGANGLDDAVLLGFLAGHADGGLPLLGATRGDVIHHLLREILGADAVADGLLRHLAELEVLKLLRNGFNRLDALQGLVGGCALDGGKVGRGRFHGVVLLHFWLGGFGLGGFWCDVRKLSHAADSHGGIRRDGDERVFQDFPIDDAIGSRSVRCSFQGAGGAVERTPKRGQIAGAFALTAFEHPAECPAVEGS